MELSVKHSCLDSPWFWTMDKECGEICVDELRFCGIKETRTRCSDVLADGYHHSQVGVETCKTETLTP